MPDHVHVMISIPPTCAVSQLVRFIKGKSAIHLAHFWGRRPNFLRQHSWARRYFVSTVERRSGDKGVHQKCSGRLDQMNLWR
jgi:putative transposase